MDVFIKIKHKVKQAECLLYSFRNIWEPLPVILLCINSIMHALFIYFTWDYINLNVPCELWEFPEWYIHMKNTIAHYFEVSVILWFILFSLSRNWRKLSKGSLWFMFILLVVNGFYTCSVEIDKGLWYFYGIFTSLFIIFLFTCIFVVTKR